MTDAEIAEGWRQARIQECLHIMSKHRISIEEIAQAIYNDGAIPAITPKADKSE